MVCKCDQLPHLCCKSEVANSIDVHSQYQLETKRDIHVNPLCDAEGGHMVCSSLGTNQPMKTHLQSCQLIQGRVKQLQVSDPEDTVILSVITEVRGLSGNRREELLTQQSGRTDICV